MLNNKIALLKSQLSNAQGEAAQALANMEASHSSKLDELKNAHEETTSARVGMVASERDALVARIAELEKQHAADMAALEESLPERMKALERDLAADYDNKLKAERQAAEDKLASQIEELKNSHEETTSTRVGMVASERDALVARIAELEKQHAADMAALEESLPERMKALERDLAADYDNKLKAERQAAEDKLASQIEELKNSHEETTSTRVGMVASERDALVARIAELEKQHAADMAALEESLPERMKALERDLAADYDNKLKAERQAAEDKLASQIEELRKQTDAQINAAQQALAEAKAQYEANLAALNAEHAQALNAAKEAAESADAILLAKISKLETESSEQTQMQIAEAQKKHAAELANAQAEIDALLQQLAGFESKNVAGLEQQLASAMERAAGIPALEEQIKSLKASLSDAASKYEATLANVKQEHAQEIEALKADQQRALAQAGESKELKAKIQSLESQLQSEKDKLAKAIGEADATRAQLEAKFKASMESTRAEVIAQAEDQRKKLEQMFRDESAKARAAFEAEVAEYEKLVKIATEELKAAHAKELSDLVAKHKIELGSALAKVDTESAGKVTTLEAAKADLEAKIASLQAQLGEQTAAAKQSAQEAAAASSAAKDAKTALSSAQARLAELEKEMDVLSRNQMDEKKLATLTTARDAAQARVSELEKQLAGFAGKEGEISKLKEELAGVQAQLNQQQGISKTELARLTSEFEAKYADMQQKHKSELDDLARQALADVTNAENKAKKAESELVTANQTLASASGAMDRAEKAEADLASLRTQFEATSTYKERMEKSESQLVIVREKLGVTEKKLADFLALYGEERKVLEESRKIADDLDKIKRRYATSMEIDETSIDDLSNKVQAKLAEEDDGEKMQAMLDGRAKGDTVVDVNNIPVWAYYALGVATAILPRIIAGGGL